MSKLNINRSRKALQAFDFNALFIEELGWSHPSSTKALGETLKELAYSRKPVAELSGALIFEIAAADGQIPEAKTRAEIAKEIQKKHFEHVLIFVDKDRSQSVWHWLKNQDKKTISREHFYSREQPGDAFIAKIAALVVDISEFDREGKIAIAEVAGRIKSALDIEKVVKKFFKEYQQEYVAFLELIEGIDNEADRKWYASVILNRLMFIYFLQKKMFLDKGDTDYLGKKLSSELGCEASEDDKITPIPQIKKISGSDKFYSHFLQTLFFEGFAKPENERSAETNKTIGEIKYLNGGLFLKHKIELKYAGKIKIPDLAFANLFALFDRYSWTLDDSPGGADNEMNPDVLGYIFEKYINQKAFGAYYTRTEITEYLCEQTVYKLILDAINGPEMPEGTPETLKKQLAGKRYANIAELLLNADAEVCRKLLVGENAVLPNLSLLDPACGSGAFLVAAMKVLINVYAAVLGKIDFIGDKKLTEWKENIKKGHPNINYFIKKQIISNNLYGVDLMEEATEIAKLRLFLALVASAETAGQLEPLPNIDFNIMPGNSLIGLMRVDESAFKKHQGGDLFQKSYRELLNEREAAIRAFKSFESAPGGMQLKKESIDRMGEEAGGILNLMLAQEFADLGIKHEQATWDTAAGKEGKPIKRGIQLADIQALRPFHWGYAFSEIFRKKNGFDAIITNPPWEILKPDAKEFFADYSDTVSKKKMDIKAFEKEQSVLLQDKETNAAWTNYLSRFPHQSAYFRAAKQYENQISTVNGKKAGTDINLYKLFTEQCHNLLKPNGYCGIVIPSGIYTDLGSKQLRKMLFEKSRITGLFCFENRKEIFEGVHRMFKFVVMAFEKGGQTISFPAAFMRHDVAELAGFPKHGATEISVEFIKKQSPDSLSVMEIKNAGEFEIVEKLSKFPLLGEEIEGGWNIRLSNEFHMTNDSRLFKAKQSAGNLPLYEGKMIWQFEAKYAAPKYWIDKAEGRKAILGKQEDKGQILDYQRYRLAFRDISGSANERTMIMTVLPKNVFCPHTMSLEKIFDIKTGSVSSITNKDRLVIASFCNSFVFDYQIRGKVTSHLSFFIVYGIPVPRLSPNDHWYSAIVSRAARLICVSEAYAGLWEEVMQTKWDEKQAAITDYDRNKLRAELDGIIAHVYGLSEAEFAYILGTFPIVAQAQKVAAHNAYRDVMTGILKPF